MTGYSRAVCQSKNKGGSKGLYCYWAVVELGYSLADLARLLGMTGQGVGYAVQRGERIAKANNYRLID
ncbi:MAG: hypothetical protein U9N82_02335 [Thermodesulfobacteriota bacterium]|nr:hypothetical protein [Thermodesulfobacteriota bacterium]